MIARAAVLALLLPTSACFAELWGGANPWTRSSSQLPGQPADERTGASWSLGFAVGMWLDAFGLGLGVAPTPLEGTVIHDNDQAGGMITERGTHLRADVDLPTRFMNPWIYPRVTLIYDRLDRTVLKTAGLDGWDRDDATGYGLFGGYTMTLFNRDAALSLGPSYSTTRTEIPVTGGVQVIEQSTTGLQARLLLTCETCLNFMKYYTPSVIRPGPPAEEYHPESLNRAENPRGCAFNPHCY